MFQTQFAKTFNMFKDQNTQHEKTIKNISRVTWSPYVTMTVEIQSAVCKQNPAPGLIWTEKIGGPNSPGKRNGQIAHLHSETCFLKGLEYLENHRISSKEIYMRNFRVTKF